MTDDDDGPVKAYENQGFLKQSAARPLRILAEYLEPEARFEELKVSDTIVFWGSARVLPRDEATAALAAAKNTAATWPVPSGARHVALLRGGARIGAPAHRMVEGAEGLAPALRGVHGRRPRHHGGGQPGRLEAKGINVGLGISLPREEPGNPYITRELSFEFHYFFMRKLWFVYLAKALVVFPGGFGTLDEFFEIMTMTQTRKMKKRMPIVMYGRRLLNDIIDFDAMARHGTLDPRIWNCSSRSIRWTRPSITSPPNSPNTPSPRPAGRCRGPGHSSRRQRAGLRPAPTLFAECRGGSQPRPCRLGAGLRRPKPSCPPPPCRPGFRSPP